MNDLPTNCTIYTQDDKTYIKISNRDMVTVATGQKRWFRGVDDKARKRAASAIWRYIDGYDHEMYELALF